MKLIGRRLLLGWVPLVAAHGLLVGCKKAAPPDALPPLRTVVVLGSSTAAGFGASRYDSAWVGRCAAYLLAQPTRRVTLVNLALGGSTSYHALPTGARPVPNRPAPDTARNVTRALRLNPWALVINLPTNDVADGYAVDEVMQNFATITEEARRRGVRVWVTTAQPRNLSATGRARLRQLTDRVHATFGDQALDFWTDLAAPDGTLRPALAAPDAVHCNDAGHAVLFRRVLASGLLN